MRRSVRRGVVLLALIPLPACAPVIEIQPDVRYGGRAQSIAVQPGGDPFLLVASHAGGLFRSDNGGQTWKHVDSLPSWRVVDVAYSPANGNIVLATTQDDYATAGLGGIWRSADGGRTWSRPPSGVPTPGPRCTDRVSAYGISFDRNTGRAVVGTDCGIAISDSDGVSWTHVVVNAAVPTGLRRRQNAVWSVLIQPGARIYSAGADGIGVSANGGGTWTVAAGPMRAQEGVVHALAASPFNVDYVFLVARQDTALNVLFLSTDAARTWTRTRDGDPALSRPGFVRTARAADGSLNAFDVYFGGGIRTWRRRFTSATPPAVLADWTALNSDHSDSSDVAFSRDGLTPILATSDGGVHRTMDRGATWNLTGAGRNGYNALQITDTTGQLVAGTSPHTDVYFATQDNSIWASRDDAATWINERCCEGFHLRTPRRADSDGTKAVTGMKCGQCRSFLADSHLVNLGQWPNAPDGDSIDTEADNQGVPFLVRRATYIQITQNDDVDPPTKRLMLTTDAGTTWTVRGPVSAAIRGRPLISNAESTSPVVYVTAGRPGTAADGSPRLGLVRIDNLYGPGDVRVADADVGLQSVGVFPTMFARYQVFGVDPADPNHLIVADNGGGAMMSTRDAGLTWSAEPALTAQVTGDGAFRFGIDGFTLATAIGWDPENPCHVLLGTAQNGILRSIDRGMSWEKIEGSERLTNLSSFFFETSRHVIVSSYGRGLWRLRLKSAPTTCALRPPRVLPIQTLEVWDLKNLRLPFKNPGDPPICPECTYVLVNWGEITEVETVDGKLQNFAVSGGVVRHVNRTRTPVPLPLVAIRPRTTRKDQLPLISDIRRQGVQIKGIVLEGTTVRGFIAGHAEPDSDRLTPPLIRLSGGQSPLGEVIVGAGGKVRLHGTGFESTAQGGATVTLLLSDRVMAESVRVDDRGEFDYELAINELAGDYAIDAIQRTATTLLAARALVKVAPIVAP